MAKALNRKICSTLRVRVTPGTVHAPGLQHISKMFAFCLGFGPFRNIGAYSGWPGPYIDVLFGNV